VKVVRAAGGLVWRATAAGPELLIVHRPAKDDWSFPKGKLEPGETEPEAALREVEEETGLRCRLQDALGTTSYRDGLGRPKTVWYWAMAVVDGELTPNREVDRMAWTPMTATGPALSYDTDRSVLERFTDRYDRGELGDGPAG
jgi:8-oxo-dGTP pyrophosphatase MutT (NUDIX family)